MPIYDARAGGSRPGLFSTTVPVAGAVPFPTPCRVIDAAGAQVAFLLWCDTETGECERYDRAGGRFRAVPGTGRVATIRERRPAPLVVVPLKPGEPYLMADLPAGEATTGPKWFRSKSMVFREIDAAAPEVAVGMGDDEPDAPFIVGG